MREQETSATALLILRSLVFVSRDPAHASLMSPAWAEACERFLRACDPEAEMLLRRMDRPWTRRACWMLERAVLPGMLLHYVLRKRFIEDAVRQGLQSGFGRVVVLGAGFDTLCCRLRGEFPGVQLIEADHPATQKRKAVIPGLAFEMIPIDFTRESLADKLSIDSRTRTMFVWEGVTMYLSYADVRAVFGFVRERAGAGSRIAFTFMEPDAKGRLRFVKANPIAGYWLRNKGEPFTWGLRRSELPAFLDALGFRLIEATGEDTLRQRYLRSDELLVRGECIALAEVA